MVGRVFRAFPTKAGNLKAETEILNHGWNRIDTDGRRRRTTKTPTTKPLGKGCGATTGG